MKHASFYLRTVLFALTFVSAGSFAAANGERPRLQDYPSYSQFLRAVAAWDRANPNGEVVAKNPTPAIEIPPPPSTNIDPTSELAPPPFIVKGPENLDTAVELARDIEHPDYKEKIRYNRTTHLSFPLQSIDGQDMSTASVGDALSLGTVTGGSQEGLSAAQLSSLLEQEGRRQLEARGDGESARAPSTGMQLAPMQNRSQISVSSH